MYSEEELRLMLRKQRGEKMSQEELDVITKAQDRKINTLTDNIRRDPMLGQGR